MKKSAIRTVALASLSMAFIGAAQAQLLVSPGTKATVTVQYSYAAVGSKPDKYDPREWRVSRSASVTAQLAAQKPQAMAQLRAPEAAQLAKRLDDSATAASAAKKMAPMASDMMKIVAKCGDSEACIEKEVAAYGNSMQMTPDLKSAGKDIEKLGKQDGPRYQLWQLVSMSGTYSVDEFYKGQSGDPLCIEKPRQRCNREETRKGSGQLPVPQGKNISGLAQFEIDAQKKDLVFRLPAPMGPLPDSREIKSDFPDESSGRSQGFVSGGIGAVKPFTVTIPGDLKQLSGTQQMKLDGAEGESGTLTVRWTLTVP